MKKIILLITILLQVNLCFGVYYGRNIYYSGGYAGCGYYNACGNYLGRNPVVYYQPAIVPQYSYEDDKWSTFEMNNYRHEQDVNDRLFLLALQSKKRQIANVQNTTITVVNSNIVNIINVVVTNSITVTNNIDLTFNK